MLEVVKCLKLELHSERQHREEEERRREAEQRRAEAEEAKCAQLKQEIGVLARQKEQMLVEKQQFEQRSADIEQSYKEEVRRLQADLKRKEAEIEQLRNLTRPAAVEDAHSNSGSITVTQQQLHGGRAPSVESSRRLFHQHSGTGSGSSLDAGSRTPPTAVATAPVNAPLPTAPATTATAAATTTLPLSARHAPGQGLPRQTPRTASSAPGLQWAAAATQVAQTASSGPLPSPHRTQRSFVPSGREPHMDNSGVRSLVSEFERRSTSRGAPPLRSMDPSPNRHVVYAGDAGMRGRPVAGTPVARVGGLPRRGDEPELGPTATAAAAQAAACGPRAESPSTAFNFGMSPMPRQQVHHAMPSGRAAGVVSSSPSAQPTVSVQDRIRQFNPRQQFVR